MSWKISGLHTNGICAERRTTFGKQKRLIGTAFLEDDAPDDGINALRNRLKNRIPCLAYTESISKAS
jgi:hypothetical protein